MVPAAHPVFGGRGGPGGGGGPYAGQMLQIRSGTDIRILSGGGGSGGTAGLPVAGNGNNGGLFASFQRTYINDCWRW